jgi:hypothetical protein
MRIALQTVIPLSLKLLLIALSRYLCGEIVWEYTGVVYPTDSQRLENGNTLICDKGNKRVIEVTPDKEIVWEYMGGGQELTALYGVRALDNGNVLIADQGNMQDPTSRARIIEVTPDVPAS